MRVAIITSQDCPAGKNVKQCLLEQGSFRKAGVYDGHDVFVMSAAEYSVALYTIVPWHIHAEHLDRRIDADLFIFATAHRSRAGIPALTVHAVGNWGSAEMGGADRKLGIAPALLLKRGLQLMASAVMERNLRYDVMQEATHHGPLMEKPVMFMEIGSDQKAYADKEAGSVIAEAIRGLLECQSWNESIAIGIGGLHHTPNFRKLQLSGRMAVGHVCPKHQLKHLTPELLQQAAERSWPTPATTVIVDWKGLGGGKQHLRDVLDRAGMSWTTVKNVKRNL